MLRTHKGGADAKRTMHNTIPVSRGWGDGRREAKVCVAEIALSSLGGGKVKVLEVIDRAAATRWKSQQQQQRGWQTFAAGDGRVEYYSKAGTQKVGHKNAKGGGSP